MWVVKDSVRIFAGGAVALCLCGAAHAEIVIDEFNGMAEIIAPPTKYATVNDTDVLGGERDMMVAENISDFDQTISLRSGFGSGVLSYNEGTGEDGVGVVTWDGDDDDPASETDPGTEDLDPLGLGGIDLTEGGLNDGIGLDLLSADIETDLTLTLYTDEDNFSTLMIPISGSVPPAITLNFPFADFVAGSGASGPADVTNIGAIVLTIDITEVTANDVTIDRVVTTRMVPLPAAVWAAVPVLAGLGVTRRWFGRC